MGVGILIQKEGEDSLILDILLLVLLLLGIFLGAHRGFCRSIINLIGTIVALAAAMWIAGMLSEWIFQHVVRTAMTEQLSGALQASSTGDAAEAIFTSIPSFLQGALEACGITLDSLRQTLAESNVSAAAAAVELMAPIVISLMRSVLSLVLFVVLIIVIKIIAKLVSGVCRLPVLRQLDKGLGAVLGAVEAVLIIFLICFCLYLTEPFSSPEIRMAASNSQIYQFTVNSIIAFTA